MTNEPQLSLTSPAHTSDATTGTRARRKGPEVSEPTTTPAPAEMAPSRPPLEVALDAVLVGVLPAQAVQFVVADLKTAADLAEQRATDATDALQRAREAVSEAERAVLAQNTPEAHDGLARAREALPRAETMASLTRRDADEKTSAVRRTAGDLGRELLMTGLRRAMPASALSVVPSLAEQALPHLIALNDILGQLVAAEAQQHVAAEALRPLAAFAGVDLFNPQKNHAATWPGCGVVYGAFGPVLMNRGEFMKEWHRVVAERVRGLDLRGHLATFLKITTRPEAV